MIYDEKKEINRNYQSFMEIILRSKEKEKDIITDYLGSMTVEERRVEDVFKANKLERWSRGQQKGLYMYESKTYEEERLEMEQQALREARLNKKDVITDRNRDIFDLELMIHEDNEKELDVNELKKMFKFICFPWNKKYDFHRNYYSERIQQNPLFIIDVICLFDYEFL